MSISVMFGKYSSGRNDKTNSRRLIEQYSLGMIIFIASSYYQLFQCIKNRSVISDYSTHGTLAHRAIIGIYRNYFV